MKLSRLEQLNATNSITFAPALPNPSFCQLFAEKSIGKRVVEAFIEMKSAAMEQLVSTWGTLICEVRLGSTMTKPRLRVLAGFDVAKRTWTWAFCIDDWRLSWATNDIYCA
jgi:hypothetical protein